MSSQSSGARPAAERRRDDRRQGDRRRQGDTSGLGPDTRAADSAFASHADGREPAAQGGALARVVRIYIAARAAIGVALVLALVAATMAAGQGAPTVATLCLAYAVLAVATWLLPRFQALVDLQADGSLRPFRRLFWVATIGVDAVAFVALHLVDRSTGFNFAALLALPVLMAGVLMPRLLALAMAAAASLALLLGAWSGGLDSADPTLALARAGLAGIGFFVITVLAGELAARLTREEAAARDSLDLARRQAQLNRLVIQEMADGVLVVDRTLRVRAANPAARALLSAQGMAPPAPFDLRDRQPWAALVQRVEQALSEGEWPEAGTEVELTFKGGLVRTLRLRVRFTQARGSRDTAAPDDAYAVLLLEDLRTAQARLRQEKLAAMGRVSAGIAHEIRNPLAAISQANALLLEDPLAPDQQRLARMVADNVRRLQRIVDDVMELAPAGQAAPQAIDGAAVVSAITADWARTVDLTLGPASRLRTELPDTVLGVSFDAEHLRRVLVNLLDNAHRHASADRGAIFLRLATRDELSAVLQVISDGPLIEPAVERHLFEPFFSTRSRGSGLGLYICRELCERYGASIEYRPRPSADRLRNEFLITMRRAPLEAPHEALPLNHER
ncbi:MAG: ATP-binding protein [Rubrivivax sp.]|nr:ATP-binding protein [Rubrivivax sp.]MDH5339408.1 ATP-binding protein [Rubrivivax sp.]